MTQLICFLVVMATTAPVSTTPADRDQGAPRNLKVTHGQFGIDLEWSQPASAKIDGYRIYRSEDGGKTFKKVEQLKGNQEHKCTNASDVKAKTTYVFLVRSYTASGESGPSNKCSVTTAPFVMTCPNSEEIDLSWAPSIAPDVHEYAVYRSTDMKFKPSPATLINIVEEPHFEDAGLKPNTDYTYHVMCIHENGTQTPVDESTTPPKDK